MPEIEQLMSEWPEEFEKLLETVNEISQNKIQKLRSNYLQQIWMLI